jgi:hypothetical protein
MLSWGFYNLGGKSLKMLGAKSRQPKIRGNLVQKLYLRNELNVSMRM